MVRQLIQRDPDIHRRDDTPIFDNGNYFTIHSTIDSVNTLSSGQLQNTKGNISMTEDGKRSSENWQLYYQQGRYFIRNYDYLGTWQLGLTEDSKVVPRLLPRDGSLGQQWTLEKQDDGNFRFLNGLLGNDSALGLVTGNTIPAMQVAGKGTAWTILPNLSAQGTGAKDPTMLKDNTDFEIEEVASSSISPSATSTSSPTASGTVTKAGDIASTTSSPTQGATGITGYVVESKSSSLAPGAIAGIAIGIVLLLALAALLGYFLWSRRKPKAAKETAELGSSHSEEHKSYYAHHAPVGQQYIPQQPQQQAAYAHQATPETPAPRYEMGSSEPVVNQSQSPRDVKQAYVAENQISHRAELG